MSTAILQKSDASAVVFRFRWRGSLATASTASQFVAVNTVDVPVEPVVHRVPNADSLAALEEVANSEIVAFKSWKDFFSDLYDDEC